jgi:dTDP-4-amino-4,6-dideoxygalactose transaminase
MSGRMTVPMLDLHAQHAQVRDAVDSAVRQVFESQRFILGPIVEEFEAQLAAYSGCRHGVGMSSGTDALLAALMTEAIGPGDEVITSPFSFFATAGVVHRVGAKPVFADIDPATFNLDPARLDAAVTSRTRAIIPVHLFGQMADMQPILEVAERHRLVVVEDAAQAIGAEEHGRRAGSLGHQGCLSFFPSKNLGAAGDAGMVVCNDAARADQLRCLRGHGARTKYHHDFVGGNFRIDALQAAVLGVKFKHLDGWTARRQQNAARYRALFAQAACTVTQPAELDRDDRIVLPLERPSVRHIYNQFVIRTRKRDALRQHLTEHGIGNEIYYPRPFHLQECFAYLGHAAGDFPLSERACEEVLALPIYPELTHAQIEYVVATIVAFLEHRAA